MNIGVLAGEVPLALVHFARGLHCWRASEQVSTSVYVYHLCCLRVRFSELREYSCVYIKSTRAKQDPLSPTFDFRPITPNRAKHIPGLVFVAAKSALRIVVRHARESSLPGSLSHSLSSLTLDLSV